jgi:hypothetical protein
MGQAILRGYATQSPVVYEPCEPIEPVVNPFGNVGAAMQNDVAAMKESRSRRQSMRRSINVDNSHSHNSGHLEEPGAAAGAKDGDGEWMYNLDTLADEHKKKGKKK